MRQRGDVLIMLLIYAAIVAAVLGAIYGVYYSIDHRWETTAGIQRGTKDKQTEWDAAKEKQRKEEAQKSADAAKKKGDGDAKAKVIYRTITQTVDRYIDRPIYRNMCFDADGLRDVNNALGGKIAAPAKPDGTMPRPDAAK